jgi:hypothetical protein
LDVAYALPEERRLTAQRPVSFRNREIRIWLRWIVLRTASWTEQPEIKTIQGSARMHAAEQGPLGGEERTTWIVTVPS